MTGSPVATGGGPGVEKPVPGVASHLVKTEVLRYNIW
jgi:hypothetical protein